VPGLQPRSLAIECFDRPTAVIRITVPLRNTSASVVENRTVYAKTEKQYAAGGNYPWLL
jgi:hypothetical protein